MKMKLFFASMGLMASITYAQDFKLGYVDVAKIFSKSTPAIALQNALKLKFEPQQKDLQKMNENLLAEQAKLQAIMKKSPTMDKLSSADRASLERLEPQYQKDQMAFQQKYTVFQQSLQRAQDFASAAVLKRANDILKDISDKGGYDLVLTSNQLVYVKPKYDLTDQVIEQLKTVDSQDLIAQLNNIEKQPLGSQLQQPLAPSVPK